MNGADRRYRMDRRHPPCPATRHAASRSMARRTTFVWFASKACIAHMWLAQHDLTGVLWPVWRKPDILEYDQGPEHEVPPARPGRRSARATASPGGAPFASTSCLTSAAACGSRPAASALSGVLDAHRQVEPVKYMKDSSGARGLSPGIQGRLVPWKVNTEREELGQEPQGAAIWQPGRHLRHFGATQSDRYAPFPFRPPDLPRGNVAPLCLRRSQIARLDRQGIQGGRPCLSPQIHHLQ
jgi:hypothetical protein